MMKSDNCAGPIVRACWLGKVCIASLMTMATVACSSSGSEVGAASGQRLYRQTCALCHGARGEGKSSLGASLQASDFVRGKSDEELVQFLIEGRAADHPENDRGIAMPPRGGNSGLSDEDLVQIVTFMRTFD